MRSPKRSRLRGRASGLLVLLLTTSACGGRESERPLEQASDEAAAVTPAFEVTAQPIDSVIFEQKIAWAQENRLDTLPIGSAVAALGRTFVGTTYTPGTLELDGPERLIINLRELDCVTFIENVLALVRVVRAGTPDFDSFRRELVRIRYRNGILNGYASRLHYFSEWIANNSEKGVVADVTLDVGGVQDTAALSFMSRHRDAYRQLSDAALVEEIRSIELTLSGRERFYIPQDQIAAAARGIRDGDIIAATSTEEGLDVAHTGFALWVNGRLHLMHAPLVGSVVEISEAPLAERIRQIRGQDGIMVARPL